MITLQENRILAGNLIAAARDLPANTELAQLPAATDFQLYLSRVDAARPLFVICAKDTVVSQLAGAGTMQFQLSNVRWHRMEPGDTVYVPAGTPHRYRPDGTTIQLKYKAANPGPEAAAWYCARCATEVYRHAFDPSRTPVEAGYEQGQVRFDAGPSSAACPACGVSAQA